MHPRITMFRSALPIVILAIVLWLAGIGGGLAVLASYASAAPAPAPAPAAWPTTSRIPREPGRRTLVLFIHPKCPCSAATLGELNRILGRAPADTPVVVAFYAPSTEPPEWGQTRLRRLAEALKGVHLVDDVDAREARLFGAVNSGHAVVCGPDGQILFRGGITASRGHEGDNLGVDCVVDALTGRTPQTASTPTYGCEITPAETCTECVQEDRP